MWKKLIFCSLANIICGKVEAERKCSSEWRADFLQKKKIEEESRQRKMVKIDKNTWKKNQMLQLLITKTLLIFNLDTFPCLKLL